MKQMEISGEIRKFCPEYLSHICDRRITRKQESPFIAIRGKQIRGIFHLQDLLSEPLDTMVLQAWPGQYSTDIFYFVLGDVKKQICALLCERDMY
jgi:hypothetical protein